MDHKEVRVTAPQRQKKSSATERKFRTIEPKILYFGTPVALVSSLNEDGSTDLAPILSRHPECVVNVPSPEMWQNLEKLAPLTGKNPVPKLKSKQFRFEPRKFAAAELTPLASEAGKAGASQGMPGSYGSTRYRAASTQGRKAK
jgi:flavin reductase (DIM6/NTAB) family NADH-FMN oxidoreductase RutF